MSACEWQVCPVMTGHLLPRDCREGWSPTRRLICMSGAKQMLIIRLNISHFALKEINKDLTGSFLEEGNSL